MPEFEPSDPRIVPASGPHDARIVVLGEAPGKNEDISKIPFIGASGKLLFNDILAQAGIDRKSCYVDNVSQVKPPKDVFSSLKGLGVDLDNLMLEAKERVQAEPRDLIICCGNAAMETLTGKKGIMNYRGSFLQDDKGTTVIPMIHPAAILRDWKLLYPTRHDAQQAKFHLDQPDFDSPPREIITCRQRIYKTLKTREVYNEPHTADQFLEDLQKMQTAEILSYDIETYAETITVFGIADTPDHALSIPFTGHYSAVDEARLIEGIRDLLGSDIPKVAQNGVYDNTYLANNWGVEVRGYAWDTMLMHHNCYAELPHSLAFLCSIYTKEPFYKMMAKEADHDSYDDAHWEYNALDCALTLEAFYGLKADMKSLGVENFYWTHYLPLTYAIGRVQNRGIVLDKEEHARILNATEASLEEKRARMLELVGHDLNINSPKQLKEYLYGNLGLSPVFKRGSSSVTTNEDAILKLRKTSIAHREFLDLILELRGLSKTKSTYLVPEAGLEDPDGRVRTSYNIAGSARKAKATGGTETGRLSSSTNAYGRGGNLQNIPKWLRSMYGTTSDEWVFWQADLSSAESYVVAWDSGDENMLEILQRHNIFGEGRGDKIWYHEFIGHIITGLPLEDITGEFRDLAKTVGHGWNYGMGLKTMVDNVNLRLPNYPFTQQNAKECNHALDTQLAAVTSWRHNIRETIRRTRTLKNCFGRQRLFLGRFDESTFREGFAFIPQSEVGDWINKCLTEAESTFSQRQDVELLGQVHDSLFGQCRRDVLPEIRTTVLNILQRPLPRHVGGTQLRIPCEWQDGSNWKETS